MAISERAGLAADPAQLVDVDRLIGAYHDIRPDPADPAQRVAFGTSGHRGSAFNGAFNEAHIAATTEAICRYREAQRHGRSAVHRSRHARPLAARVRDRARRPRCARCRHPDRRGRRLHADTRDLARDPRPQPGAQRAARRRDRRHPVAQPARGRRLQVQPAQRRPRRHRRHGLDPGRGQPPARSGPGRGAADRPRRRRLRRPRPTTSSGPTWPISPASSTWTPSARRGCGSGSTRSVGRAWRTGRRSASATAST